MILIESTKVLWFLFGALYLSIDIAVLRTSVRFQPETAVIPQLSLGAKAVGRLYQRNQLSRMNRTDARNLTYNSVAPCFRLSFKRSRRASKRKACSASSCW